MAAGLDLQVQMVGEAAGEHRGVSRMPSRRESVWAALHGFLANRLVLLVVSYLTGRLFYDAVGQIESLYYLWHRWDVLWFIRVADHGYHWYPPPVQSDLAFFPLYPLLMHLLTLATPLSAYAAGLLTAGIAFFVGLYLLHRMVLRDFSPEVAERTITYVALFPAALFFFTAYSEGLYFLCSVGCIYALRLRRWWAAGLCGMAATLTRQPGVLLVVPFLVELYEHYHQRERLARPEWLGALGACLLIPVGLVAYWAYLQARFDDGFLFLKAQVAWQRTLSPPWQGPLLEIDHVLHLRAGLSPHTIGAEKALSLIDLTFLLLFLALVTIGARRLPVSYTAYSVAVLLAILVNPATGNGQPLALLSIARFEAPLFPPFIVLALLGRSRTVDRLVLALFVALLALFTNIFVRGRWIA